LKLPSKHTDKSFDSSSKKSICIKGRSFIHPSNGKANTKGIPKYQGSKPELEKKEYSKAG
jgi:hypothetical protein